MCLRKRKYMDGSKHYTASFRISLCRKSEFCSAFPACLKGQPIHGVLYALPNVAMFECTLMSYTLINNK